MIWHIDDRASGSWVKKREHLFGFRGPQPRSRRRNLFVSLGLILGIFVGAATFVYASYAGDSGQKWFGLAMVLNAATLLLSNTAEALYAGAFEGLLVEQRRVLRAVTYLIMFPASVLSLAAIGYLWAGTSGALVGGAVATIYSAIGLLYDLRREHGKRPFARSLASSAGVVGGSFDSGSRATMR